MVACWNLDRTHRNRRDPPPGSRIPAQPYGQGRGAVSNCHELRSCVSPIARELFAGLRELGYAPGQNIVFEFRSAEGVAENLPVLANELVALKPDLLLITGTEAVLTAAKITKTVPIVMVGTTDVLETGLVQSLARPGGNITGLAINAAEIAAKRVQLLQEAVPRLSKVAVLWNGSVQSMTLGFENIEKAP